MEAAQILSITQKLGAVACAWNPGTEAEIGRWLKFAGMAKLVSFRFIKRPFLKKHGGEKLRKRAVDL